MVVANENNAIILDPGSGYMKCGFSGDDAPRSVFPNAIGIPREDAVTVVSNSGNDDVRVYVGGEAIKSSGVFKIIYCIKDGKIENWDAFHNCVVYAIETELRCDPTEHYVLLTEAPSNTLSNRVKMFEELFDTLNVPGAQCQVQAVLSLYASGRTTGMVLDSGDGVTHIVPVFKGFGMRNSVSAAKNAGRNITLQVLHTLNKYYENRDYREQPNKLEIGKDIKVKVVRMALDYEEELKQIVEDDSLAVEYQFPDGSTILCKELVLEPAEIIHTPRAFGIQEKTMREMIQDTMDKLDVTVKSDLYGNTVCSGGTTMMKGYVERFKKEYVSVVPDNAKSQVVVAAPDDREFSVFSGASILASLSSFESNWITIGEYQELGQEVIKQKRLF